MTYQEFKRLRFRMTSHLSLADEHRATYQDESGRLGFCNITPRITEFEYGRSRLAYRIDTTWYDDKKAFIRALRNFAFGPTLPETKQEQ